MKLPWSRSVSSQQDKQRPVFRAGMVLTAGNALSQILSLVRNLIVARLVAPADFGVAVTFAVTLSVLEAAFAHGFDKLLIQDRDGEDETLQSMLHSILIVRGLTLATMLFFSAPLVAKLFGIPEATTAYQLLALIPLLRGFMHLDVKRIQRHMNFGPGLWTEVAAQVAGITVAAVYAWLHHNYWAMLWGILAQLSTYVVLTHLVALRPYRLGWNPVFTARVVSFSWPLMVNGGVLVLSTQADRLIVGAMLSLTDLAVYSAAAILATAPFTFLAKVGGDLSLPWISAAQSDAALYQRRHAQLGAMISLSALVFFVPLALTGMDATRFVFGADYGGSNAIMAWLSIALGLRFLRVWPIVITMSFSDTQTLMRGNIMRAFSIVFVVVFIELGAGLPGVAAAVAIGEGMATSLSFVRLQRFPRTYMTPFIPHILLVSLCFLTALAGAIVLESLAARMSLASLLLLVSVLIEVKLEPGLARLLLNGIGRR